MWDDAHTRRTGRPPSRADKEPLRPLYSRYHKVGPSAVTSDSRAACCVTVTPHALRTQVKAALDARAITGIENESPLVYAEPLKAASSLAGVDVAAQAAVLLAREGA